MIKSIKGLLNDFLKMLIETTEIGHQRNKDKKFPNNKDEDQWYLDGGWKKTEWGYSYLIDGIGLICIKDYGLYRKTEEAKGAKFYDCTPIPIIKELKPGESANVGVCFDEIRERLNG